jgi:AraC-like DNA-binding protein
MDKTELGEPTRCVHAYRNRVVASVTRPGAPHTHPCTEIILIEGVSGWMHEEKRKARYAPGRIVVYQPGPRHWAVNDPGAHGFHNCIGVVGGRARAIPARVYPADLDLVLLFKLVENALVKPRAAPDQRARLDQLADLVCQGLLEKALKKEAPKHSDYAAQVKGIIDAEFLTPATLEQLAARVCISPDYLRQRFRREYGVGPIHYLLSRRIDHARDLLSTTDAKVHEIAAQCGFEDPYYFSRLCKKFTGKAPGQLRSAAQESGRGTKRSR